MSHNQSWKQYQQQTLSFPELGMLLDFSKMNAPTSIPETMEIQMVKALDAMKELENGSISNPDENRMVGHYWLRNPDLAPSEELKLTIETAIQRILDFASEIHFGTLKPQKCGLFKNVLLIGIGGSALGPQFVQNALGSVNDKMKFYFLDNTDPDGIDQVMDSIGGGLTETLTIVISKSGGTKETRNAMLEVKKVYQSSDLDFSQHAVAVTGEGSQLDQLAQSENWIRRFPMWDWVGGRTSELSAVGLLPAALQGLDISSILAGAKTMDELTRQNETKQNPAVILAWIWHHAGNGQGEKAMVMLPYKDRLMLFSRYLQQLVMESLGKEKDLAGNIVNQGLTVYGNKGSTDQHAFVQQLREGPADFFVTFIEILKDRNNPSMEVEPGITAGDYLQGFYLGTREALYEADRTSLTITLEELTAETLGALIALFERAVGIYAHLIGINAYHQPGVEAGKLAATNVIELSVQIQKLLNDNPDQSYDATSLATALEKPEKTEVIFKLLAHLEANQRVKKQAGDSIFTAKYQALS